MNCEHVAYLHFILWHHAQLWLELLASSLMDSNQGYHICPRTFFRDSIALLLESICFLEISCFLQLCNQAYVSQFWCIGFFLLLVIVAPHALNVAVYVQVCRLFCVLYMALFRQKWKCSQYLCSICCSNLCMLLISLSFPSEGWSIPLALGMAWKASWISFLISSTFSVAHWNFKSCL